MANTSARMLRLLSLLQTHRYWPGAELADRLEVSPRTLRRDVDRLRELGYPVDASRGVAGGYQLQAGAAVPPLLLDDDEAVAIAVGLRVSAVAGFEETSVRALAKLIQLLPPRLRRRIDALRAVSAPALGGGPALDAAVLTTLAMACRGEERLRFDYTPREGEGSSRYVEPHHLVPIGRRWYLLAWDLDRGDWRSFRVDRLAGPALTGARFRPREIPGGDPAQWLRSRMSKIPSRYDVSVVLETAAGSVRSLIGQYGTVDELGESSCRMHMSADDLSWPVMVLGVLGVRFTIESPDELRDAVRATAETLLQGATPPPGQPSSHSVA
ncbi:helix-turn-helix transcriptional regulator [Paractinoplanes brasiliensis]|uniref:Putative DNA-binding transcriptional regulator YafY n=1 Tax=Paractinoplanes brasiliensis TaxID=52695 RepID=A0A4R6JP72_9ACTN|nr:YafY family protein [Actinoplanes brasiliensis]TDO38303.1 putative DNA-binding transcriptional regulator YafY [Actinoplanes brasiliensis]